VEVVEGHAPPASLLVFIFNREDEDQGERRCHVYIMEAGTSPAPNPLYLYKDYPLRVIEDKSLHMQSVHVGSLSPILLFSLKIVASDASSHRQLLVSSPPARDPFGHPEQPPVKPPHLMLPQPSTGHFLSSIPEIRSNSG
jgi:hypothetical protein